MKGSGSHHPRSPKDKVTFAEFTEVLPKEKEGGVHNPGELETEASNNGAVDSCNNTLGVPGDLTKLTVLDTINEHPQRKNVSEKVLGHVSEPVYAVGHVPLVTPESDLSPCCETSRLIAQVSDSQD